MNDHAREEASAQPEAPSGNEAEPVDSAADTAYLKEYRAYLSEAEQKAQADYDKTVLSLSGGALGISFAFLKDIVGTGPHDAVISLHIAWVCWGISVSVILLSFFLSQQSLRKAIHQVDTGRIDKEKPGGSYATATSVCNAVGGSLFIVGVLTMIRFVVANLDV